MRISDWSSDVCSSDLRDDDVGIADQPLRVGGERDVLVRGVRNAAGHTGFGLHVNLAAQLDQFVGDGGDKRHTAFVRTSLLQHGNFDRHIRMLPERKTQNSEIWTQPNPVWSRVCRSEEHTSELQSLMRISYAVFCLKKKK